MLGDVQYVFDGTLDVGGLARLGTRIDELPAARMTKRGSVAVSTETAERSKKKNWCSADQ